MKQMGYPEARTLMQPGDVIAFGGKGYISKVIKAITNCNVSHVGVILQTKVDIVGDIIEKKSGIKSHLINQIIESTSIGDGFAGVSINRMSTHLKKYDGEIWWLPLSVEARKHFDQKAFFNFMLVQEGKKYDTQQAILSALDFMPDSTEDLDKLFCSELVSAGFKKGFEEFFNSEIGMSAYGIAKIENINSSEQTPFDVCSFEIYDEPCQIKGDELEIF